MRSSPSDRSATPIHRACVRCLRIVRTRRLDVEFVCKVCRLRIDRLQFLRQLIRNDRERRRLFDQPPFKRGGHRQ